MYGGGAVTDNCGSRTLAFVLAYTGIRWGEAVALKVRDVEFLRWRLSVSSENAVQLGMDHAVGRRPGGCGDHTAQPLRARI